jgi:hypothetical protein
MLIWNLTLHSFEPYKSLGRKEIHQVGEHWFTIPQLKAGGDVQRKTSDNSMQLRQGDLMLIRRDTDKHAREMFLTEAKKYFQTFYSNNELSVLGSHLANIFSQFEAHLELLHKKSCENKIKIARIDNWVIRNFPRTTNVLVTYHEEETIVPAGDVVLGRKCVKTRLSRHEIIWERK